MTSTAAGHDKMFYMSCGRDTPKSLRDVNQDTITIFEIYPRCIGRAGRYKPLLNIA